MPQVYPSFTPTYHNDQYPAIDPTQPALDCSKKIVLITGAARGIGKATALAFAQAHAKGIVLLGRTKATLDEAAEDVRKASEGKSDVLVTVADTTSQNEVQAALKTAVAHFSGEVPHVLINNAGGAVGTGELIDVDIDEFMKCFDLNVRGPLTVAQALARSSREHSCETPKTVINLPSGGAILPYIARAASYSCSKLANAKLCEYLHYENPSWNVFNMQPGVVATELAKQVGRNAPDTPEMPAGLAVWLSAHPDARHFNGKFIWANWDIEELLARKDEIQKTSLLTLSLKGWAEECSDEDLIGRAASLSQKAKE